MSDQPVPRAAFCEVHGLRYDPNQNACPICKRQLAPPPPARSFLDEWKRLLILGGLFALAVVVIVWATGSESPDGAESREVVSGPSRSTTGITEVPAAERRGLALDPERVRTEIEAIEHALYEVPREAGTAPLAPLFGRLRLALSMSSEEPIRWESALVRFRSLEREVEGLESIASLEEMDDLRRNWISFRDAVFLRADWYVDNDPARLRRFEEGQTVEASQQRAALVNAFQDAQERLTHLLYEVSPMALSVEGLLFQDPHHLAKQRRYAALRDQWTEIWKERAPELVELPDWYRGRGLRRAREEQEAAVRLLPAAFLYADFWPCADDPKRSSYSVVPDMETRQRRLRAIDRALQSAREAIEAAARENW